MSETSTEQKSNSRAVKSQTVAWERKLLRVKIQNFSAMRSSLLQLKLTLVWVEGFRLVIWKHFINLTYSETESYSEVR